MFRIKYMHHKKNLSVLKEICVLKIVYLLAIHHSCQCRNEIQQSRCCKSLRGTNQKKKSDRPLLPGLGQQAVTESTTFHDSFTWP